MGIPSGLPTNPLVARPLSLLRIRLLHHYSFRDKISFCLFLLYTSTYRFKWIRIGLPHHLPLWHASDGLNHLLPLLGKISSQYGIFPKEVMARNQIETPFYPHHQTTPSKSLWPWAHLPCIGWVQVGGASALVCLLHYILFLSSFVPTLFLP